MKAHEVTTLHSKITGLKVNYSVRKYIVVSETTSKAVSLVPLRDGEEVLEAKELQNYTVIVEKEHERT